MKLLKLHVALQHMACLHVHRPRPHRPSRTVKVLRDDGLVSFYERPVLVSELLARFPKHQVCHSDALYIGQKIPALGEEEYLQPGHSYFLLPFHCFQTALSFASLASFLKGSKPQNLKGVQPLEIQKAASGDLRLRVSADFVSRLLIKPTEYHDDDDDVFVSCGRVCSTPQLQKDYSMLVDKRSRCWKPKLETISENKKVKKKSSHRRKFARSNKKSQQQQQQQLPLLSSSIHTPKVLNHSIPVVKTKSSRKTK